MAVKTWNPVAALGNWLGKGIDEGIAAVNPPTSTDVVPAAQASPTVTPAKDGEPVSGRWVDSNNNQALATTYAQAHTEEFRRIVESFDEEKQTWLAQAISKVYMLLAYLLPPVTAWYVGMAIGDAFSGGFTLASAWSVYAHLISVSLEMMLPVLGLAVAVQLRRSVKDRSQVGMTVFLIVLFICLGIGNSFAQIFLIDQHLQVSDLPGKVAVGFRAGAPLVIDVIATVYLSVVGVRSLKKYLADQRAKIEAVRDVNQINIELDSTTIKAAIEKQSAVMDMESKAHRAQTWNEIERMQAEAMISQARKNMLDQGDNGGSYRRSRY